ncbi:uncharacterized protein LTHEOB_5585 [Lasiodiplodia theobromae]|uniref:uncharacterized protein n=1 Tax=Lasiodiplodia theobromae TaxID=45133 RepID=UPI0015C31958|nr:uncharacterized protein LTHEOB_5585 [Lasiodiplodia theobromae]KAF4545174.1 hypothetical protein LTHEOB_5585 [Lasiodiplodia theobromae]
MPTPALNTTCNGTLYNVKPGDDCHSISRSEGIGTAWLLSDNHLHAYCSNFPGVGHTLCIKNTCDVYTISANDTCSSVASAHGITVSQLRSWNPVLDMRCGNMPSMVGDQICISSPGPRYATGSISGVTNITTSVPVPTNIANGTNTRFSIPLDDFIFLNPSINKNCTNLYAYKSYCVKAVGSIMDYPGQPGCIGPTSTIAEIPYSSFAMATYIPPTIKSAEELPLANGTIPNCSIYADGDELNTDVDGTSYKSVCDLWAEVWGISITDLVKWYVHIFITR